MLAWVPPIMGLIGIAGLVIIPSMNFYKSCYNSWKPNGTHSQPAPHPVNLGHTTLSGQAANLPHAFNPETLQELSSGAWT
nr:hypothetical protein [Tanacetum cinerariifolium]